MAANSPMRLVQARRWGKQREGYAPGGPADRFAAAVANRLAGNADDTPVFEIPLSRGSLCCDHDVCVAVSGAPLQLQCDGVLLPNNRSCRVAAGSALTWQGAERGFRSYLAIQGGIEATDSPLQFMTCPVSTPVHRQRKRWATLSQGLWRRQVLRILAGPEASGPVLQYLTGQPWQLSRQSNAHGVRLLGEVAAPALEAIDSAPVQDGTVQLTPSGPIVLMRERQTVGGYPRIAQVLDCDINLLAQYRPGQRLYFNTVTMEEAVALEQA
ncbi:MAG TPA: hypothetical protein VIN71_03795, partial [Pseudomonadales bacterium]